MIALAICNGEVDSLQEKDGEQDSFVSSYSKSPDTNHDTLTQLDIQNIQAPDIKDILTKTDKTEQDDDAPIVDGTNDKEPQDNYQHDTRVLNKDALDYQLEENETGSTLFTWFKSSFIDPIFEEFNNGLNSKSNDTGNETSINSTEENFETLSANTTNMTHTEADVSNITDSEASNSSDAGKKQKFECLGRNVTENTNATVKLITTARLLQLLSTDKNETENVTDCMLVMFYAPWCHFCAKTAPHYNALARAFPQMDFVAVDTAQFSNLLPRFGTVSVPTVIVFHQSRAAVKFNQTERNFENFVVFVKNTTGLDPDMTVNVTDADYLGPVPSIPTDDTDYLLIISWIFVIFCSSCMFIKSSRGQQCIRQVRQLWQEHQHID